MTIPLRTCPLHILGGWVGMTVVFSLLFDVGLSATRADEPKVPWLEEVQRPPAAPPRFELGTIKPLLVKADGTPIRDREEWAARRKELRDQWLSFLGPMPNPPSSNRFEVLKTETLPEGTRQLIRYECEKDLFVEAYLLRPDPAKQPGRRPGVVALHQTTSSTIDETAGVSGPESLQLGLKLARRGFVVICPRCFLWQDVKSLDEAVARFRMRHPETLGMHKMLYDARRATDILADVPEVDPRRLTSVGHSLGAKEVLYLAAFDERIRATVASEGGLAFKSTNWDAPWYLGKGIREPSFERNHHELLALMAPRAFLILGGEQGPGAADGDRSWPLIEAALPVHRLFSNPPDSNRPALGLLNHHKGHSIPDDAYTRMAEWLETYSR